MNDKERRAVFAKLLLRKSKMQRDTRKGHEGKLRVNSYHKARTDKNFPFRKSMNESVIDLLKIDPHATNAEIAKDLGVEGENSDTVSAKISLLRRQGRIGIEANRDTRERNNLQKRILEVLKKNPDASGNDIARITGVNKGNIQGSMHDMIQRGKLPKDVSTSDRQKDIKHMRNRLMELSEPELGSFKH